ncbi:MAG: hypothetical protein LBR70_02645 [Lactobacillaceae bacterium]|jgi:lysine decarboxylase/arginine decarboxylase|nr:hypothetical protein [Lactobacillaceae bacterium]
MYEIDPFQIKILLVFEDFEANTAAARAVRMLEAELEEEDAVIEVVESNCDAEAVIVSDPSIQCVLLNYDSIVDKGCKKAGELLKIIRKRNNDLPVFLLSSRAEASEIPTNILSQVNDFIWLLEDTSDFIAGRIIAATERYREFILPPMFKSLAEFAQIHEYSWHTPGHTGGTAFLRSPAGRAFFNFFGEPVFRSDLSISVGEVGSLLDHSGPIGESEKYIARVFGADRSYTVTNGSSTSNRVILMASVTRNQVCLCDRNCHKSVEHAMTMSGAVPTYLVPVRNQYGIIGPILPERLTKEAVKKSIKDNALSKRAKDTNPVHAIITNSTYDGLCYNVKRVNELLGQSVDRMHYDEAWYGYAKFNTMYKDRFAMSEAKKNNGPTIFATQSTHKLLAAFSQASMIHIRDGKNSIPHARFNEAFMMHASTSPFYPIIASNDVSAAMMDKGGEVLTEDSIKEAVSFRRAVARINAEYASKKDWFFNCWQPDTVMDPKSKKKVPFYEASEELLSTNPDCWVLKPKAEWHGFGDIEDKYCMLDPIKVSVTTPGILTRGGLDKWGIPASILTAYLDNKGIVVEKTTDFTILFLFSLGVTKGKWGTLINALFEFKKDYDNNTPLERVLPSLMSSNPERYNGMGLKDLANEMFAAMSKLGTTKALSDGFSVLPYPDYSPVEAYEELVKGNVESVKLKDMANRTVATGVVPYPPGIPLMMPGENAGSGKGPLLGYLKALEAFDNLFPGFTHDTHGVEVKGGDYEILCIKKKK